MKSRLLLIGLVCVIAVLSILLIELNSIQSKELLCLNLYKDINEISRTPGFSLAEIDSITQHRDKIFEYVRNECPDFTDLSFYYNHYE